MGGGELWSAVVSFLVQESLIWRSFGELLRLMKTHLRCRRGESWRVTGELFLLTPEYTMRHECFEVLWGFLEGE